jgi:thiamine-phosphate pyrophosphorylase
MDHGVLRILDANLNRAREGLRVVEDYARMILNDSGLTVRIKELRHRVAMLADSIGPLSMLTERDTPGDVGTRISVDDENRRLNAVPVAMAALKRVGEALRCIEEYSKIGFASAAANAEKLRYELYSIEQDALLTGPRRQRLACARLHVLITASLSRGDWMGVCRSALAGGAEVLQLREKTLSDAELLSRARTLREITRAHDALLVINDRPDIARLADADGIHVGGHDLPVAAVRQIVGPTILIGKSTHSMDEARAAIAEAPDYIAVGPMFPSPTKPDVPVQGPSLLTSIAGMNDLPIVAIGGITAQNVERLRAPRPFAVAVSNAVIAAADPEAEVRRLLTALPCEPLIT